MVDNFSYLFWAYAIFWIALFIYVYSLLKKSKELRRRIKALNSPLARLVRQQSSR
ncbi:MAG: CcmD family protein [Candidatus Dadabacteria bacterium]